MLAFSGISHAGFMLMALLSLICSRPIYYCIIPAAYALAGIASFAVVIYVTHNKDNEDILELSTGRAKPAR